LRAINEQKPLTIEKPFGSSANLLPSAKLGETTQTQAWVR
jgi:hypothetical protein